MKLRTVVAISVYSLLIFIILLVGLTSILFPFNVFYIFANLFFLILLDKRRNRT